MENPVEHFETIGPLNDRPGLRNGGSSKTRAERRGIVGGHSVRTARGCAWLIVLAGAVGCTDYYEKRYERAVEAMAAEGDASSSLTEATEACSSVIIGEPEVTGEAGHGYRVEVKVREPGVHFQNSLDAFKQVTLQIVAKEVLCIFRAARMREVPLERVQMSRVLMHEDGSAQELYRVVLTKDRLETVEDWDELPGWFGSDDESASATAEQFEILHEDFEGLDVYSAGP
jgi:hypothetical protein